MDNPYLVPIPINPCDVEIYHLHTEEKRTITWLAKEYGLKEKSIRGICAKVRKSLLAGEDMKQAGYLKRVPLGNIPFWITVAILVPIQIKQATLLIDFYLPQGYLRCPKPLKCCIIGYISPMGG